MIKFAPKKQKHIYIATKKETKVFVYKSFLPLVGNTALIGINSNV
jgi:hypothetical protein